MYKKIVLLAALLMTVFYFSCVKKEDKAEAAPVIEITDGMGRKVPVPDTVSRIICSGPGCLRYITYMECWDNVVAVDDMEKERPQFDARPYAFAHPEFRELPIFGEFRGNDNPELISALAPGPELVFKTYGGSGFNPDELQQKTTIPVCVLDYGDIGRQRQAFYRSLDIIGNIMKKEKRAEEIKQFFNTIIDDLDTRTKDVTKNKTCYIGGVAYRGPLGLQSTEPGYPPFLFLNTRNAAVNPGDSEFLHINVSKESIVAWDPDIIFIDLATLQSDPQAHALYELQTDPAYASLTAVKTGNIYGVLPYNWYTQNHGSTLANAYFIGKVLYPESFSDIDPAKKADEIYEFLVGEPVFAQMDESFQFMAYKKLEIKK